MATTTVTITIDTNKPGEEHSPSVTSAVFADINTELFAVAAKLLANESVTASAMTVDMDLGTQIIGA